MLRYGFPPYLECSSKGERRFSAFSARLRSHSNQSIEALYQGFKIFPGGISGLSTVEAKGRLAINQKESAAFYRQLWIQYIEENPELYPVLLNTPGVSDVFGQPGHVCQATELWRIRVARMAQSVKENAGGSVRIGNKRAGNVVPGEIDVSIDVDRSNKILGNPFVLKNKADPKERAHVIDQFTQYTQADMLAAGAISVEVQKIAALLLEGKHVQLNCWCSPLPCHASIIASQALEIVYRKLTANYEADFTQASDKTRGQPSLF